MELKFRHFCLHTKEMLYSDRHYFGLEDFFSQQPSETSDDMQFTGLKDKNGVEVYDGDICVNESGRIAKVIWFDSGACFDFIALNDAGDSHGYCAQMVKYKIAVIGNIHENPELIKPL